MPCAQPAPTTKIITLAWDCTGTCLNGTLFTVYKQINCTGPLVSAATIPAPTTSVQVSSSLIRNTCWYVTVQTSPSTESYASAGISFPITLTGGFPIRLSWSAPVGGVAVAQYRIYKQIGCTGSYVVVGTSTVQTSGLIPFQQLQVVSVDSEQANFFATFAIDGNVTTFWHTQYTPILVQQPHTLILNLGASYQVNSFRYLPRQDSGVNGTIAGYEFYVSTDGVTWGSAVATGTFTANDLEKIVNFTAKTGQYVRLISLSEVNGGPWTSAAEIGVSGTSVLIGIPLSFIIPPPVSAADCWQVTAVASDNSESAGSTPFQIPSTILGGTTHSIFGSD